MNETQAAEIDRPQELDEHDGDDNQQPVVPVNIPPLPLSQALGAIPDDGTVSDDGAAPDEPGAVTDESNIDAVQEVVPIQETNRASTIPRTSLNDTVPPSPPQAAHREASSTVRDTNTPTSSVSTGTFVQQILMRDSPPTLSV